MMLKTVMISGGAVLGLGLAIAAFQSPAQAQDNCNFGEGVKGYELDADGVDALYECIADDLVAGYASGDNAVAAEYRSWGAGATAPYAPGPHGDRLLMTFVNDIGLEQYVQYSSEGDFSMPVGSILAKESFSLRNNGNPRPGPLFIMTKVAEGEADEFDNWVYSAVQPNGNAMGIQQSFCHNCHQAFEAQDSMGYPAFDVRLGE